MVPTTGLIGSRAVARDAVFTVVANGLGGVLVAATLAIWARALPPSGLGVLALALAIGAILRPALDLGLNSATVQGMAVRFGSQDPSGADGIAQISTLVRIVVVLVMLALAPLGGRLLSESVLRLPGSSAVASIGLATGALLSLRQHVESLLRAERRFLLISAANLARFAIPIPLTLAAVASGRDTPTAAALVFLASPLIFLVFGVFAIPWRRILSARPAYGPATRLLLGFAGWIAILRLLDIATQVDVPILNHFASHADVAYYFAAYKVVDLFTTLAGAVSFVLLPYVSRAMPGGLQLSSVASRILTTLFFLGAPLGAGAFALAPEIVRVVWGGAFTPAVDLVRILAPGAIFALATVGPGELAMAAGRPRLTFPMAIVSFVSNVLLLLLLVPGHGMRGAAWATTLSYGVVLVVSWGIVVRGLSLRIDWSGPLRVMAAAIPMALVLVATRVLMTPSPIADCVVAVVAVASYLVITSRLSPEIRSYGLLMLSAITPGRTVADHPERRARPAPSDEGRVCLTGDVHNRSAASLDQLATGSRGELEHALRYQQIASALGVKVTLFVAGKAALEDPDLVAELGKLPEQVEIGVHEFEPFSAELTRLGWHKLFGTYGPRFVQMRSARRARRAFAALGMTPRAWSSHSYRRDRHLPGVLRATGYTHVCNLVDPGRLTPWSDGEIIEVPINTSPDHENVIHPTRVPPKVRPDAGDPSAWLARVTSEVEAVVSARGVAVLRVHPTCMAAVDDFQTFERLCTALARYRTVLVTELGAARDERLPLT